MNTLSDEDLRSLLGEAAGAFPVPELDLSAALPAPRRWWLPVTAAASVVALLAVLGVAALRGGDRAEAPSGAAAPPVPASGLAVQEQSTARSGAKASGPESVSFGTASGGAGAAAPAGAAPAPAAAPVAPAPAAAPAPDGAAERVVKTGAVALLVDDDAVTPTLTAVQAAAKAEGGYVAASSSQESGTTPSGSVTLRVPVQRFEPLVARVRALKAEVRSATTSGKDVTAQYADVAAQIRTLKAARERFLEILSGARTIGEVLTVQQRVDDTTVKIDRLEGQLKVLADSSDLSTLTVSVTERDDPVVAVEQRSGSGLGQAVREAREGFTSGVEGLVARSGRALLALLCLAALVLVARVGWRVARRRLV